MLTYLAPFFIWLLVFRSASASNCDLDVLPQVSEVFNWLLMFSSASASNWGLVVLSQVTRVLIWPLLLVFGAASANDSRFRLVSTLQTSCAVVTTPFASPTHSQITCRICGHASKNCEKRLVVSPWLSVCLSECYKSSPTEWMFM